MNSPRNKAINTKASVEKQDAAFEETFMFPHSPTPVVVQAKDIVEAQEKFEAIIKSNKNNN